jgi:hypothetical protein
MAPHKRIEITIQSEQIVTIRRRGCNRRWCAQCGCDVEVVDLAQAEALSNMAQTKLGDRAEGNKWHALEDLDGTILVCLQSLLTQ